MKAPPDVKTPRLATGAPSGPHYTPKKFTAPAAPSQLAKLRRWQPPRQQQMQRRRGRQ
jgi:hypothetical protein